MMVSDKCAARPTVASAFFLSVSFHPFLVRILLHSFSHHQFFQLADSQYLLVLGNNGCQSLMSYIQVFLLLTLVTEV